MSADPEHLTCSPEQPCGLYRACAYCTDIVNSQSAQASDRALLADRERYRAELDDPERVYAVTTGYGRMPKPGGEGKIHERDCQVIRSAANSADTSLEAGPSPAQIAQDVMASGSDWRPTWPRLLTRAEAVALRRHLCRVCAPDLPRRTNGQPATVASGTGWPLADGTCVKYARDIARAHPPRDS